MELTRRVFLGSAAALAAGAAAFGIEESPYREISPVELELEFFRRFSVKGRLYSDKRDDRFGFSVPDQGFFETSLGQVRKVVLDFDWWSCLTVLVAFEGTGRNAMGRKTYNVPMMKENNCLHWLPTKDTMPMWIDLADVRKVL